MCCAHSYNMQACPIISEQLSETRVGWKSDREVWRRDQVGEREYSTEVEHK